MRRLTFWSGSSTRSRFTLAAAGLVVATGAVLSIATPGEAVNTRTFVLDSSADFSAGVLDRVAVTSDGQVMVGVDVQRIATDQPIASVWSVLDLGDGSALVGTGVDGRIYRVDGARATLYAETGAVVVTSLARGEDGTVYAATLPEGRVFRLHPPANGHPAAPDVFVRLPGVEHVWALAWDRTRHVLLAATGPEGRLFAIDRAGHATVVYDSDEPHLYSLAMGDDGTIYAGAGGGHAVLYAIRAPGQATALARFAGDEVKSIVVAGHDVYAAANEFADPPDPPHRTQTSTRAPSPGGTSATRPRPGHGSVWHVRPDGTSERLYYNADAHVTALELDREHAGELLAALGVGGRVVAIAPDRTSRVAIDVDENQVLALAVSGRARLFGTGDTGAMYLVTSTRPTSARWTSKVLDGGTIARWGAVRWRGTGHLDWEARSGNSDPVDSTWSAWTALSPDGVVRSPSARYLQVRARWSRDAQSVMRAVSIYYLPTNQRAVLTEVSAESKLGESHASSSVHIGWKVENPDGDALRYRLRFRADQDTTWRPLVRNTDYLSGTSYDWTVDGLPEGYYRVQVDASDEASNPDSEAQHDARVSEPVLVDNTPPHVTVQIVAGHLHGEATDGASAVVRIETAVDAGEWRPVRAADGVLDERVEAFDTALTVAADGGEHVVAVRAYDEAGNVGTTQTAFRTASATAASAPVRRPARR